MAGRYRDPFGLLLLLLLLLLYKMFMETNFPRFQHICI